MPHSLPECSLRGLNTEIKNSWPRPDDWGSPALGRVFLTARPQGGYQCSLEFKFCSFPEWKCKFMAGVGASTHPTNPPQSQLLSRYKMWEVNLKPNLKPPGTAKVFLHSLNLAVFSAPLPLSSVSLETYSKTRRRSLMLRCLWEVVRQ